MEVVRIKVFFGKFYDDVVEYFFFSLNNGIWKDFYNIVYVVWVFKSFNVFYDYEKFFYYFLVNFMWMLSEKNLKIGDFVYYLILIYYFL